MKNQAMVMTDIRKFELQDIPMPVIGGDEVGIRVTDVGICGSDAHFAEGHSFQVFPNSLPFVLGHEFAGEVYEVGANVTNFKAGDRVTVEPGLTCGTCEFCTSGRYNLCPDVEFLAVPPHEGVLKRYISYPAYRVFKLPDNVTNTEGALIEPLSVGIQAAKQGGVNIGSTVAILGSGCIGLCTLLAAKAFGAPRIIVTDLFDSRLERAKKLGATDVINSKDKDPVQAIGDLTGGKGADIVFETAGNPTTVAQTSFVVKRGGTIVMVGNTIPEVSYSFRNIYLKEAEIKSVFRYRNTYPLALQAVASGRIDVKSIVTDEFDFEDTQKAFDCAIDNKTKCLKTVIHISDK